MSLICLKLLRKLSLSIFAILAPVAVLYVGGGVYFGGGSGKVVGAGDGDLERDRERADRLRSRPCWLGLDDLDVVLLAGS